MRSEVSLGSRSLMKKFSNSSFKNTQTMGLSRDDILKNERKNYNG